MRWMHDVSCSLSIISQDQHITYFFILHTTYQELFTFHTYVTCCNAFPGAYSKAKHLAYSLFAHCVFIALLLLFCCSLSLILTYLIKINKTEVC